ncbi:MAG TPA: NAD-dependent epimerase/dehydratase family protein, partial [Nitrospira sp.]|nr:NAD-dependent epimerase/dehydratase family protein [Nitrospira sp.]
MKVLVTGATGFVGGAVVRALLRGGVEVRVLARSGSSAGTLSGLAVERVEGDLLNPASLEAALAGCQQLYHVGAYYALWAKDPSIFYEVNVAGTRNMLLAARRAGIQRTVYCSTIGAIGVPAGGGLGTEDTPVSLDQMAGHYKRSKYLAE